MSGVKCHLDMDIPVDEWILNTPGQGYVYTKLTTSHNTRTHMTQTGELWFVRLEGISLRGF